MYQVILLKSETGFARQQRETADDVLDHEGVTYTLRAGPRQPLPTDRSVAKLHVEDGRIESLAGEGAERIRHGISGDRRMTCLLQHFDEQPGELGVVFNNQYGTACRYNSGTVHGGGTKEEASMVCLHASRTREGPLPVR